MSVNTYNFYCQKCGHTETLSDGLYLFSDECFTMLRCPQCHKIMSEELSEIQVAKKDYLTWPDCSTILVDCAKPYHHCHSIMTVKSWHSDTI